MWVIPLTFAHSAPFSRCLEAMPICGGFPVTSCGMFSHSCSPSLGPLTFHLPALFPTPSHPQKHSWTLGCTALLLFPQISNDKHSFLQCFPDSWPRIAIRCLFCSPGALCFLEVTRISFCPLQDSHCNTHTQTSLLLPGNELSIYPPRGNFFLCLSIF